MTGLPSQKADSLAPIDVLDQAIGRFQTLSALVKKRPRVAQALRDIVMIAQPFVMPERPVSRVFSASENTSSHSLRERQLRVAEIIKETQDAITIALDAPHDSGFMAGQFITLLLNINGQEYRRSYSLSSAPDESTKKWSFTVKRISGGVASNWIHDNIRVGQFLKVRGPSGSFTYDPSRNLNSVLLIGGGSGITPLFSILTAILTKSPNTRVTLIFANRRKQDVIFADKLEHLATLYSNRFSLVHVLEENDTLTPHVGRIDLPILRNALAPTGAPDLCFVCGPAPMMDSVQAMLTEIGVDPEKIKTERFASLKPIASVINHSSHRLSLKNKTVLVRPGETILQAALENNLDLDYSCTMGGCGACKVKLASGAVTMEEPNCLSSHEREQGVVLACVSHPTSDVAIDSVSK